MKTGNRASHDIQVDWLPHLVWMAAFYELKNIAGSHAQLVYRSIAEELSLLEKLPDAGSTTTELKLSLSDSEWYVIAGGINAISHYWIETEHSQLLKELVESAHGVHPLTEKQEDKLRTQVLALVSGRDGFTRQLARQLDKELESQQDETEDITITLKLELTERNNDY